MIHSKCECIIIPKNVMPAVNRLFQAFFGEKCGICATKLGGKSYFLFHLFRISM